MHAHHVQTPESVRQIPIQVQFTANVWQEGDWFVAQCKEVEVARHGRTEKEALDNLREAFYLKANWLPQTQKRTKGKRRASASLKKKAGISETYGNDIEAGYREMAKDEIREVEASLWAEISIGDLADESR